LLNLFHQLHLGIFAGDIAHHHSCVEEFVRCRFTIT
jgi:hypothetical protein